MWQAVCRKLTRRGRRGRGEVVQGPWLEEQVERKVRETVDRYGQADDHDRLALWLQHRDLRPVFSQLEKYRQD